MTPETVTDPVTVEWRPIPGAPGYEASSEGEIRSHRRGSKGKILKPWRRGGPDGQAYRAVWISGGSRQKRRKAYVHELVAAAFHGRRPSKLYVVSHLDEDKENCRPDNLKWDTQLGNMKWWGQRRRSAA